MQKTILRIVDSKGIQALQDEVNSLIETGEYRLSNVTATPHPWEGGALSKDPLLAEGQLFPPVFLVFYVLEHAEKARQAHLQMMQQQYQAQQHLQEQVQRPGPRVVPSGSPLMPGTPPRPRQGG